MSAGFGITANKSKTNTNQRVKFEDLTPEEFQGLRADQASFLSNAFGLGADFRARDARRFSAPILPIEQANLAALQAETFNPAPFEGAADSLLTRTLRGEGLTPESNPFLAAQIGAAQRQTSEAFREASLANRVNFTRAGQTVQESSPFARAQALGERGFANALGDIATNISFQNFNAERNRQQAGIDQARQRAAFEFERLRSNLEAQALPRLIAQKGIDNALGELSNRRNFLAALFGSSVGLTANPAFFRTNQVKTRQKGKSVSPSSQGSFDFGSLAGGLQQLGA